jgi:hypothetical protein
MKKIFAIVGLTVIFTAFSCSQSSPETSLKTDGAVIEFAETQHDYGTIPYKGDGAYSFVFKSTGKEPLLLKNVRSSCGCTVPEWPKEPIKKGEKGIIKVVYKTSITGNFTKSISVFSNATDAPIILVIKGKVEEPSKDQNAAAPQND